MDLAENSRNQRHTLCIDLHKQIDVTVVANSKATLPDILGGARCISRVTLEKNYGTSTEAWRKIEQFLQDGHIAIVHQNKGARSVVGRGSLESFQNLFKIQFALHEGEDGTVYRIYEGDITLPTELDALIECVHGLDNSRYLTPHFDIAETKKSFKSGRPQKGYFPNEIGNLYNFPAELDGSGQCIALIQLGGGYRMEDVINYCALSGRPVPSVAHVGVNGSTNAPSAAHSDDREVMLDLLVAASIAPAARIVVYFAPNNERGFYSAITRAIHDTKNNPNVISISWGAPEKKWNRKALSSFNESFKTAAALGITICVASGDHGSSGGIQDGNVHVDFPASSPYVLSCGGTRLLASDSKIISEVVWHEGDHAAGGGGVSEFFTLPEYQDNCSVPLSINASKFRGRGVPDVAGNAAHTTGYRIIVNGTHMVLGGTSAVAPMYAGLIALLNQRNSASIGFINPYLYKNPDLFREITKGNNITSRPQRGYHAKPGWNACTGLGVLCKH